MNSISFRGMIPMLWVTIALMCSNVAAQELTLRVKLHLPGPKGSLCYLVNGVGDVTKDLVVVRDYFTRDTRTISEVIVTATDTTVSLKGGKKVPVYKLVSVKRTERIGGERVEVVETVLRRNYVQTNRILKAEFSPASTGFSLSELNKVKQLASLNAANNKKADAELRAQLIAIALLIDPEYEPAYMTNLSLRDHKAPDPLLTSSKADDLVDSLVKAVFYLGRKAKSDSAKSMVGMLLDVGKQLDRSNRSLSKSHRQFFLNQPKPSWGIYLGSSAAPTNSRRSLELVASSEQLVQPKLEEGINIWKTHSKINSLMLTGASKKSKLISPVTIEAIYSQDRESKPSGNVTFVGREKDKNNVSLPEVVSLMEVRHQGWLDEGVVEFHFSNPIRTEDGPSTSLACALLLESLVTGVDLAENYSCIGSVNSDGSVQSVGGVVKRIEVARQGGAPVVVLPKGNEYALSDLAILGEAKILSQIQIFTVDTFDQALKVTRVDCSPDVALSIKEFAALQGSFEKMGVMKVLKDPSTKSKLTAILRRTPNHASARVMMDVISNSLPRSLSLNSSVAELFENHINLGLVLKDLKNRSSELDTIKNRLRFLGPRVEPRTKKLAQALYQMSLASSKHLNNPNSDVILTSRVNEIRELAVSVLEQLEDLSRDPELIEDLDF